MCVMAGGRKREETGLVVCACRLAFRRGKTDGFFFFFWGWRVNVEIKINAQADVFESLGGAEAAKARRKAERAAQVIGFVSV